MSDRHSTWRWPIVMGVLSALGLVSALVGDGAWDVASWFALGIPAFGGIWLAVRGRFAKKRRPRSVS